MQQNVADYSISAANSGRPSFLMAPPFSHSATSKNNVWMREYEEDIIIDKERSLSQFFDLYNYIAGDALVYLLPSPPHTGLQDQVFTANLAFVPEHIKSLDTVIVSKFTSQPRVGESEFGTSFFEAMGYKVHQAPYRFEGEAEIKHLHDNVYIGGYGERTDPQVYDWMSEQFDMQIIKVRQTHQHFYHLDCSIFPLTREETIVCTELYEKEEIRQIETATSIIDVPREAAFFGLCNSLRLQNVVINASNITSLPKTDKYYQGEVNKNRRFEDICASRGYEPVLIDLSEYFKSGALLSCMVMHLNRSSFDRRLW